MSPATRTMEDALAEVAEVAALRRERIGEANELYERQLDLMVELREGFEVQAKYREIAAAIEGTVVGVDAALRKVGEKRGRKVG